MILSLNPMSRSKCHLFLLSLVYSLLVSCSHWPQASSADEVGGSYSGIPATIEQQLEEKGVLLSIVSAFGHHPLFRSIGWMGTAGGMSYNDTLPCSQANQAALWFYIKCSNGFIVFLQLDSEAYSYPDLGQNAAGGISPPGNKSYAKGIPGAYGPLTGAIPWRQITKLTKLGYLSMSSNNLYGRVLPENINDMTRLQHLSLANNNLNESIPASLTNVTADSPRLLHLDLSQNMVSGTIPPNADALKFLQMLNLYQNNMGGTLPPELGNSTSLININIGKNNFNGTLPESWSQMTQLNYLNLASCRISGSISSAFSNMTSLKQLILSHNNLSGPFPNFTGALVGLQFLELAFNELYGPLPSNLWDPPTLAYVDVSNNYINESIPPSPPNRNYLTTSYETNCFTESGPSSMRPSSDCLAFYDSNVLGFATPRHYNRSFFSPLAIILVSMGAGSLALLLSCLTFIYWRVQRRSGSLRHVFGKDIKNTVTPFSLAEIRRATKNFSQMLGKGGYGTVYKAVLKDGSIVAVKRLDASSKQGDLEFIREVELLSRLHHRHLVNLVGFCAEKGERVLVYEYMAMGSLYEHLHGASSQTFPLPWESRIKISIHIALGLEYLHFGADPPLIHRDIKSANILLSADGYCKVADFGLCKEAPGGGPTASENLISTATAIRGSFGYLDPEYVCTSVLSDKSDVYSYGVVLLELISGKKSIHEWQPLAYWAEDYLCDPEKTYLLIDPSLGGEFDVEELSALCDIARSCVQDQAAHRPTMRDVAKTLIESLSGANVAWSGASSLIASSGSVISSQGTSRGYPLVEIVDEDCAYQDYSETLRWSPVESPRKAATISLLENGENSASFECDSTSLQNSVLNYIKETV